MSIPDRTVEEVRARADIVGIIGRFVSLKRAGREYKGLSPFKSERTPSFCVIPEKQFYHCFSSGKSGDVFRFLMETQGMSFVEAVKYVGARSGVQVKERKGVRRDVEDPNQAFFEAVAFAAHFFQQRLLDKKEGGAARDYLKGRGIGEKTQKAFGIGYAPDGWTEFRDAASSAGIDQALLLRLGLLKSKNDRVYDAFRDRIVFPIVSEAGKTVGFGGRLLADAGPKVPKYLNASESPIFQKGELLYGLRPARFEIRKAKEALLVEGYMDVVSLHAHGIGSAVAPLGTSVTSGQAQLLARYAKSVRILFDSDEAGQKATFRAADLLLATGLHVSVATLPGGEDPDSIVQSGGPSAIKPFLEGALDVLDRKIQILEERDFFSSLSRTRGALDRLLPTLRAASRNPRLRDLYVSRVSKRCGVRRSTLEAEIDRSPAPPPRPRPRRTAQGPPPVSAGLGDERTVLLLMLRGAEWVERVGERVGEGDLENAANRAIFHSLMRDPELEAPLSEWDSSAVRVFESLKADAEEFGAPERVLEDVSVRMECRRIDRGLEEIRERQKQAKDQEEWADLMARKKELLATKQGLGGDTRSKAWGVLRPPVASEEEPRR